MKSYLHSFRLLFLRLSLALIGLQLARLFFFLFNQSSFQTLGFSEILLTFINAFRFDIWSVYTILLPIILLHFIPGKFRSSKWLTRTFYIYFAVTVSIMLLPDFVDTEYIKFTGKRSTFDLFNLITTGDDTLTLIPVFLTDFWYIPVGWILLSTSLILFYRKFLNKPLPAMPVSWKNIATSIITIAVIGGLFILTFRGTGYRPTSLNTASLYTSPTGINLVLNSSFSILSTSDKEELQVKNFMSQEKAEQLFNPCYQTGINEKTTKTNVVIIIVESLAKEFCSFYNDGKGYTPFLDSLFSQSLVFNNSFSNGKKTPEALPSIFAGIPTLLDQPYAFSQYANNNIRALPAILNKYGYHTAFFHGGKNGSMGFDLFSKILGFKEYYGLNEYPNKNEFDGNWGIWDENYLQYFIHKLDSFEKPFMTTVFTLSSHHPYSIPEKYKGKFKEGSLPIHIAISYSDYALKQFFAEAAKHDWYKNTLFIITGDHTSINDVKKYNTRVGTYAVPICFFHPADTLFRSQSSEVFQHTDISPTILDYLGIQEKIVTFGQSLFKQEKKYSINYLSGIYWISDGSYYLLFDGEKTIGLYKYPEDVFEKENLLLLMSEKKQELESFLMSYIQQYNFRVKFNHLTK